MWYKNKIYLFAIIILAIVFKLVFPMNNLMYGDEHRDSDGIFYLSQYDSFYHLGKVNNYSEFNILSFLGTMSKSIFKNNIFLYMFPAVLGIINTVLIYFICRKYADPHSSFFGALLYLLHPLSFYSSYKGYFDTNGLISLCLILCVYFLINKRYVLLALTILILTKVWQGFFIIDIYIILCIIFMILLIWNKGYEFILILSIVLALALNYGKQYIDKYTDTIISQLTSYSFNYFIDIILLPILSVLVFLLIIAYVSRKMKDRKLLFIIVGYFMFFFLAIYKIRFFYMFMIFYSVMFSYLLYNLKKKYKIFTIVVSTVLIIILLINTNYNQHTIIMEDKIIEALDNSKDCVIGSWDFGHMYLIYSNHTIYYKGFPTNIINFTMLMIKNETEGLKYNPNNCTIILNSQDIKKVYIYSNTTNSNISTKALFKLKNPKKYDKTTFLGNRLNVSTYNIR